MRTNEISRRTAMKLAFSAPICGVAACDASVVLGIVTLVVEVVKLGIDAAQEDPEPEQTNPLKIIEVAKGIVGIENRSDDDQLVELLVELFDETGELQNSTLFLKDGDFPVVPGRTVSNLVLPNMASGTPGWHTIRVSVGGEMVDSNRFYLEEV
jgi:hypothetical protein